MIKCKICGCEFPPIIDKHYVSRDCDYEGLAAAFRKEEAKLYDTFDCSACGCQIIVQERKRLDTQHAFGIWRGTDNNAVTSVDEEGGDE